MLAEVIIIIIIMMMMMMMMMMMIMMMIMMMMMMIIITRGTALVECKLPPITDYALCISSKHILANFP